MQVAEYLRKMAVLPTSEHDEPSPDLDLVIMIPCYHEPDILKTLESLREVEQPVNGAVEVLVVINSGERTPEDVIKFNEATFNEVVAWASQYNSATSQVLVTNVTNIRHKHAGVGMARKIGMDWAISRYHAVGKENGVIVNLDADCTVSENYMVAVKDWFAKNDQFEAASLYYEHPLFGEHSGGIIDYELFLRYYIEGLRSCGYPHSYHTIGSSMAVTMKGYCKHVGMNRRKAGEDFYFLQKFMEVGTLGEINSTTVVPSARVSDRVPFGTGKAVNNWQTIDGFMFTGYHPDSFKELGNLITLIPILFEQRTAESIEEHLSVLPHVIKSYLLEHNAIVELLECRKYGTSLVTYTKRFFRWINGLKGLQFFHYYQEHGKKDLPIGVAAKTLLNLDETLSNHEVLLRYREKQKNPI